MKCCDMTAGMLQTAITVQRLTRTTDGAGGWTETWATLSGAPTRAMVRSVTGREVFANDRIEARPVLRITTRYNASVTEADRIVIRGKAYNITAINNMEFADKWLEIDLSGGVAT